MSLVLEATYRIPYDSSDQPDFEIYAYRDESNPTFRLYATSNNPELTQSPHPTSGASNQLFRLLEPYRREVIYQDETHLEEYRWYALPDIGCDIKVHYAHELRWGVYWAMSVHEYIPCGSQV